MTDNLALCSQSLFITTFDVTRSSYQGPQMTFIHEMPIGSMLAWNRIYESMNSYY
ncbi:unnamed protein product [Penicillium salamii]|nr:unnamed protein product [Penicillium salamii]CAG8399016.1 unnamed protein product [Penicillium salamii]CAG8413272.1 unnamed protein product [Penicillium salamii]